MKPKGAARITVRSIQNCTLHWAYLEFAIRSSAAKMSAKKGPTIPVSRNVIEAIRYSYDFLDAAAEFTYELIKGGQLSGSTWDSWLTRYIDRNWKDMRLADKLGFLSFSRSGEGFWRNDAQFGLFENLRAVRNALTHPAIFVVETVEEFADYSTHAVSSQKTTHGKMRRRKMTGAAFAEHPAHLGREDANKAVEIALRHAERFEQLFSAPGSTHFSRIEPQTGEVQSPTSLLARMHRHFDSIWMTS